MTTELRSMKLHPLVLGLLAAKAAQIDERAPVRGWGQAMIGRGVAVVRGDSSDYYSVGDVVREINGVNELCVQLSVRRDAFGPQEAVRTEIYTIPVKAFREVSVEIPLVMEPVLA